MTGRKSSKRSAGAILDRLAGEEAKVVLRQLLERHSELCPEAENIATALVSSQSAEEIAAEVSGALRGVDLDALNGRAGKHSSRYVEPGEAAVELLEEAIEEWVEDMKRHIDLNMMPAAQTICAGIVAGLYACRKTSSDGALGWAPDFPAEHAGFIVQELLQLSRYKLTAAEQNEFVQRLADGAPEWKHMFQRALGA
jgi:hypothetical protein